MNSYDIQTDNSFVLKKTKKKTWLSNMNGFSLPPTLSTPHFSVPVEHEVHTFDQVAVLYHCGGDTQ